MTDDERDLLEQAIETLEDGLFESKGKAVKRTYVVEALECLDALVNEEVELFELTIADGGEPDEEHLKLVDEHDDLDVLNAALAKCTRPAQATRVSEDDENFDADVDELLEGTDEQ